MSIIVKVFRKGHSQIAELCKGSTADSDSVCEGSNPSSAAKKPVIGFNHRLFSNFSPIHKQLTFIHKQLTFGLAHKSCTTAAQNFWKKLRMTDPIRSFFLFT